MCCGIPLGMAISLGDRAAAEPRDRGDRASIAPGYYMPAIVPLVAASLMWIWILNPSYGLINARCAGCFDTTPSTHRVHRSANSRPRRSSSRFRCGCNTNRLQQAPLILMNLWTAGGGMIIWLAGLQSIPQTAVRSREHRRRGRVAALPARHDSDAQPVHPVQPDHRLIGTMQIFAEAYIMTERRARRLDAVLRVLPLQAGVPIFPHGLRERAGVDPVRRRACADALRAVAQQEWVHYEQA